MPQDPFSIVWKDLGKFVDEKLKEPWCCRSNDQGGYANASCQVRNKEALQQVSEKFYELMRMAGFKQLVGRASPSRQVGSHQQQPPHLWSPPP